MSEPKPDPLEKGYQRPAKAWSCGRLAEGCPCPFGTDPVGNCHWRFECAPYQKGSRWQCARPESRGGTCADGPLPDGCCARPILPCTPVRSLRSRRRLLTFLCVALGLGVILWRLDGPEGWRFQQPGEVTFQHGTVSKSCETCHDVPLEQTGALLAAAFRTRDPHAQNRLCLDCHDLGGAAAALAHSQPMEQMQERTRRVRAQGSGAAAPFLLAAARDTLAVPRDADGSLVCGRCHREHQGRQFDLRTMDNQRCQTCHVQQFASLAEGHPEFHGYPYRQRTPLYFDHESHIGRHFKDYRALMPNGKAPQMCADCHTADVAGRTMLVKDFAQTCASCHLPQITDVTLGGVRFLNLPGLDVDSLRVREQQSAWVEPLTALNALPLPGPTLLPTLTALFRNDRLIVQPPFAVGEWPAAAAGDLTPFMDLLLSADPDYAKARLALKNVDLSDLRSLTPRQIREVGVLVWSIKGLFYDIIQEGDQAVTRRLQRLVELPMGHEQLTLLMGDLPPSTIRLAQQRWLPSLLSEVPNERARQPLASPIPPPLAVAETEFSRRAPLVRWHAYDADCSVQYLPRRHTDLFLQSWLDLAGQQYASARAPAFAAIFDNVASPFSPGRCVKCHGVEARPDRRRVVSWLPAGPKPHTHPFTTFAHQPHFSLVADKQCATCHTLQPGGQYARSFLRADHTLNLDPTQFTSNFQGMNKATCARCHVAGAAGDRCTQCHNYHIGTFLPFRTPRMRIEAAPAPPGK